MGKKDETKEKDMFKAGEVHFGSVLYHEKSVSTEPFVSLMPRSVDEEDESEMERKFINNLLGQVVSYRFQNNSLVRCIVKEVSKDTAVLVPLTGDGFFYAAWYEVDEYVEYKQSKRIG